MSEKMQVNVSVQGYFLMSELNLFLHVDSWLLVRLHSSKDSGSVVTWVLFLHILFLSMWVSPLVLYFIRKSQRHTARLIGSCKLSLFAGKMKQSLVEGHMWMKIYCRGCRHIGEGTMGWMQLLSWKPAWIWWVISYATGVKWMLPGPFSRYNTKHCNVTICLHWTICFIWYDHH